MDKQLSVEATSATEPQQEAVLLNSLGASEPPLWKNTHMDQPVSTL
jgi:hypothetical protein